MYEHITVKNGTTQELFSILTYMGYREEKMFPNCCLGLILYAPSFGRENEIVTIKDVNLRNMSFFRPYYYKILKYILSIYEPQYIYNNSRLYANDDNIRPVNMNDRHINYTFEKDKYFSVYPSARERIDLKTWLKNTLILRGNNEKLVESLLITS